jgi:hypothetical protein
MSGASALTVGIATAASAGLNLLLLLVFAVVAATIVRRRRPDAAAILLAGLALELFIVLGSFTAQFLLSRLAGAGSYAEVHASTTVVVALGHAASRALLIWGVVRLASDTATPA